MIERMLVERAGAETPADLTQGILRAAAAVRQNRRTPFLPALPDRRTQVLLAAAVVGLLVLATALALTGASRLFRVQQLVVAPTSSPTLIVDASPSAAPIALSTPGPTQSALIAFPTRPGMLESIADFLVASDTVGWVRTNVPAAIYRTTDLGSTWTEVRPPGWSAAAAAAFVDVDTMYAEAAGTISATHDGGVTWVDVAVDKALISGRADFTFRTATDAYATFPAEGADPLLVYHTTDGGRTWTGPLAGKVPHLEASMGKVAGPHGEFLLQSAGKFPNKPFDNRFFLSADGGVTWTEYTFPIRVGSPANSMKSVSAIDREDNGRLLVSIRISPDGQLDLPDAIYESGGDTATWRLIEQLPLGASVQFLSPTDWVRFSNAPSAIAWTVDAGGHWESISPSTSLYDFQPEAAHQFATTRTGWAIKQCGFSAAAGCTDPHATLLFGTRDSGASWTQVGK